MSNKFTITIFLILCFLSTSACAATFKGRVIDADTKEPIEGAVVVASWLEERATVAGPTTRLKDVAETLTDKNGEWAIKGPKGREGGNITAIFTFLTGTYYTLTPEFIIFKPGYCSYPEGFGIEACKEKMKPYGVGNGETTELPKLTKREDRVKARGVWPSLMGPIDEERAKKVKELLRLLNEEARYLGLPELKF